MGKDNESFLVQFDDWINKSFDMLFRDSASTFGFGKNCCAAHDDRKKCRHTAMANGVLSTAACQS